MELTRKQFTFYESFALALRRIRGRETRCMAYDAIVDYALFNKEPNLEKLPQNAAIAFDLIRPTLDSGRRKAAGQKNGTWPPNAEADSPCANEGENEKETEVENENENKNDLYLDLENEAEEEKEREDSLEALLRAGRRIREAQSRRLGLPIEPPASFNPNGSF